MLHLSALRPYLGTLLLSLLWLSPVQAGPLNEWLDAARTGNQAKLVPLLAQVGINASDGNGNTALIFAVRGSHPKTVNWLLSQGANVNLQRKGADNWQGWNALMFAVEQSNSPLSELLLAKGTHINAKDVAGTTALMIAACQRPGMVEMLLARGADPNAVRDGELKDLRQGWTATMYAVHCQNQSGVEALLAAGADLWIRSADHSFMSSGGHGEDNLLALNLAQDDDMAHFLLSRMIETEKNLSQNGAYLTHFALARNDRLALDTLFAKGMPAQGYPDAKGDTPLHQAIGLLSQPAMIQALLAKGGNPQSKNKSGQTPLTLHQEICTLDTVQMQYEEDWLTERKNWCQETERLLKSELFNSSFQSY